MEDELWMERFMSQKRDLIVDRYMMATSFFSTHGIPYYEM
jgi:hypothetical protein